MQPIPQGKRVAILGSGGQGVVAADACSAMGLEVPELDGDTVRSLMEGLPPHAPVPRNPVDFAGSVRTAKAEAAVVEKLLSRDYIDGVISNVPVNPQVWAAMSGFTTMKKPLLDMTRTAMEGAEYLASLPAKYGKPIITVRFRPWPNDIVFDILRGAGIPVYDSPEQCARSMYGLARYGEIRTAGPLGYLNFDFTWLITFSASLTIPKAYTINYIKWTWAVYFFPDRSIFRVKTRFIHPVSAPTRATRIDVPIPSVERV